mmetsp:Transcript_23579/g.66171  ORF Transcript_23579/g.66171 Transcript_23579/m.66171 type:complete len:937 (+) Transcript_23579:66-2876(+)
MADTGDRLAVSGMTDDMELEGEREENGGLNGEEGGTESAVMSQEDEEDRIISSIPKEFYDPAYSIDKFVEELPTDLDQAELKEKLNRHSVQLEAISNRLSKRILGSYDQFVQGMVEIGELNKDIERTAKLCDKGRGHLVTAKQSLTHTGFEILSNHRKRLVYRQLLQVIQVIHTVDQTRDVILEAIREGDFPKAVSETQRCQKLLLTIREFKIARSLQKRMNETSIEVQRKLDLALLDLCRTFQEEKYLGVLNAYRLLGKHFSVIEKMQRYYLNAITSQSHDVIFAHVLQNESLTEGSTPSALKEKSIKELCHLLPDNLFFSCLSHILACFTDLMKSHWMVSSWHRRNDQKQKDIGEQEAEGAPRSRALSTLEILPELTRFRKKMWDHMQRSCNRILSTSNLSRFKIDSFLKVLDAVTRFTKIGEAFSETVATGMHAMVKKQSKLYFFNYHKARLEDLRTMLENEMWIAMPVAANFSLYDIQEFSSFLEHTSSAADVSALTEKVDADLFFERFRNPFSIQLESSMEGKEGDEDQDDDEDEVPEELKQEYVDEEGDGSSHPRRRSSLSSGQLDMTPGVGPSLTSTSINVLRYMGKYLHMMKILKPIKFQVFYGFQQAFEYYMLTCYTFFGTPHGPVSSFALPDSLKKRMLRIKSRLIQPTGGRGEVSSEGVKAVAPVISPMAGEDLRSAENLYGLSERAVATESLMFISNSLQGCREPLEQIQDKAQRSHLNEFFDSVDACGPLRLYLHYCIATRLLNLGDVATIISSVRWDLGANDLGMGLECSPYVHTLGKQFAEFARRLKDAKEKFMVSPKVCISVWECAVKHLMYQMVEGFSRARRCSNEGRVLMNLDLQTLRSKLEPLCPVKPLPFVDHVEQYIKAYYISQAEILPWIKERPEYSSRQLMSVAILASQKMAKNVRVQVVKEAETYLSTRPHS